MNLIIFFGLVTISAGIRIKSKTNPLTLQNTELFKYSANDEYTLSENIDDEDDTPNNFQGDVKGAKTLASENRNQGKGKFKYSLQTQNGIELQQVGKLKDEKTFVVSGSYAYTGADGKKYRVRYTADELGYHPITELDVEIPDIIVDESGNKGFQFLNQNLHDRGHGQIGDDFSYNKKPTTGYNNPEVNTNIKESTYGSHQQSGYNKPQINQQSGYNKPQINQHNGYTPQVNQQSGYNRPQVNTDKNTYASHQESGYAYDTPNGASLYLPPFRPEETPSKFYVPGY